MRDMRCDAVQQLFSEIYDGVAHDQALLVKHLQTCPACKAEYAAYKQMLDDVRNLPEVELPEGFHEAAMAKIRELVPPGDDVIDELIGKMETRQRLSQVRRKKPAGRGISRQWAGLAAAACVALVCIWAFTVFDLPMGSGDYEAVPEPMSAIADMATEMAEEPPVADMAPEMAEESAVAEMAPEMADEEAEYDWPMEMGFADDSDMWDAQAYASNEMWGGGDDDGYIGISPLEDTIHRELAEFSLEDNEPTAPGDMARMQQYSTDVETRNDISVPMTSGNNGIETWAIVFVIVIFPLAIVLGIVLGRNLRKNRKE